MSLKSLFKFDVTFDRELVIIIIFSTLALMADWYTLATTGVKALDRFFLYFVGSGLVLLLLRRPVKDYGLQLGDWRAGLAFIGIGVVLSSPVMWLAVRDPVVSAYYARLWHWLTPVLSFFDLIGWEFLFRGLLLFGFARVFGGNAIWLAAIPFAFAHLGKPALETFSTLFGGVMFGLIAWRTRSFLYPFVIHWYFNVLIIILAAINAGVLPAG
jgi:membrane protease YdiL (CAAX protease family)